MMQNKRLKRCSIVEDYEDIVVEILLRVPARSLTRFKCVSKHRLFLISEINFSHRHTLPFPPTLSSSPANFVSALSTAKTKNHCLCPKRSCYPLHSEVKIVQSCNGLFLCRPQPPNDGFHTTATSLIYYVLNPTTNKFRSLTPPAAAAATTAHPRILGCDLAFDPSKSPHYNVVFLWFVDEPSSAYTWWGPNYHIEIYSSETRSWELLDSSFINPFPFVDYFVGVYCNGAVHWVGIDCEVSYYHIDEKRVGHVDGLPNNYGSYFNSIKSRYFRESPGGAHLHLIDIPWELDMKLQVKEMGTASLCKLNNYK